MLITRRRQSKSNYIVARADGAYLARRANGEYHWAWARDDARLFHSQGAAANRAKRHGGAVVAERRILVREG